MSLASQDPVLPPTTDGLVLIRAPEPGDAPVLIAGRDEEFRRFLGPGSDEPRPAGCIQVGGQVVGWVDYDLDRPWLLRGEVNLGYHLFAPHRGNGIATRAIQLLLHHLAVRTSHMTATMLIDPANERSLALAARIGASRSAHPDGAYFKRPVPPLSYSDGTLTIRRFQLSDLEADLAAKDDEQIRWLWLPGQREAHRWKGYASRAVRLITRFLCDHTGARQAHLLVDEENVASLRFARAVASAHGSSDEHEPPLARHILVIDCQSQQSPRVQHQEVPSHGQFSRQHRASRRATAAEGRLPG